MNPFLRIGLVIALVCGVVAGEWKATHVHAEPHSQQRLAVLETPPQTRLDPWIPIVILIGGSQDSPSGGRDASTGPVDVARKGSCAAESVAALVLSVASRLPGATPPGRAPPSRG